jgi:hypothetical protein
MCFEFWIKISCFALMQGKVWQVIKMKANAGVSQIIFNKLTFQGKQQL